MDNHENLIGKLLDNRYRIENVVGEGGMSIVTKAIDIEKSVAVTIKLLNSENSVDSIAIERFTNEAKAVSLLSHSNIVSVYNVSLDGPNKYIVMEYIDGITLKEYLDKKGRLEWHEAVHYISQVLSALSHAHSKGVIHRDIKPENVMLMSNGNIKVIDFGIAKIPDSKSLTVIDKAIGTVNYISPEQASGRGSTEKSDIYSTGIMLYELTTGQLPFVSESSVSVAMMHVSSEPAMPTSICEAIPRGLEQIIIKAMMKDPDMRFGSARSMQKAIEYLLLYPNTVFKENHTDKDGNPIIGTGAIANNANNTVISDEITAKSSKESVSNTKNSEYSDSIDENAEEDVIKPAKPTMFPIVLGITLSFFTIAILFAIMAFNKFGIAQMFSGEKHDNDKNTLTVREFVGMEYTENLYEQMLAEGYNVIVEKVANVKVENGHIISQTPTAGSTRRKNEKGVELKIQVSSGNAEAVLEDYSYYDYVNVQLKLSELGIKTSIEKEYNDTVIIDHVIRTEPSYGEAIVVGDTVTLYVSKGPEEIAAKIPKSIIGMKYDAAERTLQELGFTVSEERSYEVAYNYADGTIIATEPAVGTSISLSNTKVKLIIARNNADSDAVEASTSGFMNENSLLNQSSEVNDNDADSQTGSYVEENEIGQSFSVSSPNDEEYDPIMNMLVG